MKPIVLTGMSGAGKTTVGKHIAEKLSTKFFDTDNEIEKIENKTVPEIFKVSGEKYFRRIESKIIRNILCKDAIISLGGGAFEDENTRNYLLEHAFVIYLRTAPETIYERLKHSDDRPLLKTNLGNRIKQILEIRNKNYKLAHFTVLTDNKTIEQVADEILRCVNLK